jgi:hypothetical protein
MTAPWDKLPAIEGRQEPCLHAGVAESLFPANGLIAVGFGCAMVTKDGRPVYEEPHIDDENGVEWTGAEAEAAAAKEPDHDWRIVLQSPLSGREYQRHAANRWVLVHQDEGFA